MPISRPPSRHKKATVYQSATAVILAPLLIVSSLAAAEEANIAPPARFDYPAPNRVVVVRTLDEIRELCGKHAGWSQGTGACAMPGKPCIILWPKGKLRWGLLWRHENAHCNGWPRNHPSK
jgi:hypothetical protein